MDLVIREHIIKAIEDTDWYHQNQNKDMVSGANDDLHQPWYKADDVFKAIESVPTFLFADVYPVVHGEWFKITDVDIRLMGRQIKEVYYKCSVCGGESYFDTNYCPHCGSKMDGGE